MSESRLILQPAINLNGLDRGMVPDRVLSATIIIGELLFLMKIKDQDGAKIIPARIVNVNCPQIVIKYYVKHVLWLADNKNDSND